MACFVHGLRGGIELGVHFRHHLHDARGHHQRALLAMQELRQRMRLLVAAHVDAVVLAHLFP